MNPNLHQYIVTTEQGIFHVSAEKIRIHQGVLIFTANDLHLASFKEWLSVISANCVKHETASGYTVIKPLN